MSYLSILIEILRFRESEFNDLEANEETDTTKQKLPPECTITIELDMSKAFDTINTHTVIDKLTH